MYFDININKVQKILGPGVPGGDPWDPRVGGTHGIPLGGGPWDPRVGPWGPLGLGGPLVLGDPLVLGGPGP